MHVHRGSEEDLRGGGREKSEEEIGETEGDRSQIKLHAVL